MNDDDDDCVGEIKFRWVAFCSCLSYNQSKSASLWPFSSVVCCVIFISSIVSQVTHFFSTNKPMQDEWFLTFNYDWYIADP